MADFTPGPWLATPESGGMVYIRARGPVVSGVVASVHTDWAHTEQRREQEANAHLIAAAPQMLRALELAESALAVRGSLRDGEQERVQVALETVRQVLAIARTAPAEVAP